VARRGAPGEVDDVWLGLSPVSDRQLQGRHERRDGRGDLCDVRGHMLPSRPVMSSDSARAVLGLAAEQRHRSRVLLPGDAQRVLTLPAVRQACPALQCLSETACPEKFFIVVVVLHHLLVLSLMVPMNMYYPHLACYHQVFAALSGAAGVCSSSTSSPSTPRAARAC